MPGDNDKSASDGYKFLQLVHLYHNGLTMSVVLETQYGTASGNYYEKWTRGPGSPTKVTEISGMRVAQLWSTKPNDGESVGEAVRRAVYEYLINSGEVEGVIANNPPLPPEQIKGGTVYTPINGSPADAPVAESSSAEVDAAAEKEPAAEPAAEAITPAEDAKAAESTETSEAAL